MVFAKKEQINFSFSNQNSLQKAEWFNTGSVLKPDEGWLREFKERFGIKKLKILGYSLSSCRESIELFKTKFDENVVKIELTTTRIYNLD